MSLRDKFTDEEWDAIPPFTGFHHNKVKEELLEKQIKEINNRYGHLIFTTTTKESYKGISENADPHLLDEMVVGGFSAYDSARKPLTHDDEVGQFGKVNLWNFSGGMNKDTDLEKLPEQDYKFAENISAEEMLAERIKKENQPRDVIQNIVDKIHERKLSGKQCEVAIMSYSDYDALQSMHDFKIHSVWIAGVLLKIHPSINLKDGEIEVY